MRVFIAEGDQDIRVGLEILLDQQPGFQVVGIAATEEGVVAGAAVATPEGAAAVVVGATPDEEGEEEAGEGAEEEAQEEAGS